MVVDMGESRALLNHAEAFEDTLVVLNLGTYSRKKRRFQASDHGNL
jgi:hypothetical protein